MIDVILEILRALILLAILLYLLRMDKNVNHGRNGWYCIKIAFFLLLIGAIVDVTDNYESLNSTIILGDTPAQAFIENVIGYLFGFGFLAIGLALWLPEIQAVGNMEKNLLLEKKRADFVFENAPIGICHGRLDETDIIWNREFLDILGYDSSEDILEALMPRDGKQHLWVDDKDSQTILSHLRSHQSLSNFEAKLKHKNGTIISMLFDVVKFPGDSDGTDRFCAFARDITKNKQMVQELVDSRRRLKTIIDSIPVGIYLVDKADRTVVEVNPAALDMTQYTRDELIGAHCCTLLCPGRKDRCTALEKGTIINQETFFNRKDGTQFPALKTVIEIAMHGNAYFLETFLDISEQKRLEQFKEDVDRIIQHDLRSPVISIINATQLALSEEPLPENATEMLHIIKEKGSFMLNQLSTSLVLYNIEAGAYLYEPSRIDLMKVIRNVLDEIRPLLENKHVSIDVILDEKQARTEDALIMDGNKLLAHSVINNLLTNAVEAVQSGQAVQLEVETGEPVTIRITNQGTVPPEIRDTFFKKYSTVGKTTGIGLGTYSASIITKTMHGTIDMETSDEKNQTVLTVRLPFNLN